MDAAVARSADAHRRAGHGGSNLIVEDGSEVSESAHGDGPIAAAFQALEHATGVELV